MVKIVSPWLTLVASFLETPHIRTGVATVLGLRTYTYESTKGLKLYFVLYVYNEYEARAETFMPMTSFFGGRVQTTPIFGGEGYVSRH